MRIRLCIVLCLMSPAFAGATWSEATAKLTPGARIEVHHHGKAERGLFALANGFEIVMTTSGNGFLSIQQTDVDRVIVRGTESPKLSYFRNANDQLFPKAEVVYERTGAPAAKFRKKFRLLMDAKSSQLLPRSRLVVRVRRLQPDR